MSTAEDRHAEFDRRLRTLRAEVTSRRERLALQVFVGDLGVRLGIDVDRIELFAPYADDPGGRSVRVGDGIPLEDLPGGPCDPLPLS